MSGKLLSPEAVVGFNGTVRNGLLPLPNGEQWIRASGSTIVVGGLSKSGGLNPWFLQGHSNAVSPAFYPLNTCYRTLLNVKQSCYRRQSCLEYTQLSISTRTQGKMRV